MEWENVSRFGKVVARPRRDLPVSTTDHKIMISLSLRSH